MQKNSEKKRFTGLKSLEPPTGLFNKIIARIHDAEHLRALKKRMAFCAIGLVGSLIAFIPAFGGLEMELARSGLAQMISLVFSDPRAVIAVWSDFILLILESMPVLNIAAFLGVIFIFLGLLKFFARDAIAVFMPARVAHN